MKYNNAISKIKIDENFEEELITKLEMKDNKIKKGGFIMKLKRVIITILSLLGLALGSGAVYAALGGTINGVPVLEWMGIKFSEENYEEYVEIVENQVIENDNFKIALESTVCDDGFTILQFRVNISDEMVEKYSVDDDGVAFCYLSFNDPVIEDDGYTYTNLNGANYNLIIDDEDVWVRGYSAQQIEEASESEFIIYQMWFLDETTLNGKEDFTITLNDIVIGLGEDAIAVDGNFEVEVSKEKALSNTTTYTPEENNSLTYGKMTKTLEKITITPLQNILTIRTVYEDVDIDDLTDTLDDDYVGTINYIAYDQNEENISAFSVEVQVQITYEDGTIETGTPGEFTWSRDDFEHATYEVVEKIAVEENSSISEINLQIYEVEDGSNPSFIFDNVKAIGKFTVDLSSGDTKLVERDEYIFDGIEHDPTDEFVLYAKVYYGMDYDQVYEYFVEERESLEENVSLWINEDEVEYIEISILDMDAEDLEYTDYLKIDDRETISDLIDLINDNTLYSNFEEDYGVGDFWEGSPILHIVYNDDSEIYIVACDNLSADGENFTNVFFTSTNKDLGGDNPVYECQRLASSIEDIYQNNL